MTGGRRRRDGAKAPAYEGDNPPPALAEALPFEVEEDAVDKS
jgi:hypothetical protein